MSVIFSAPIKMRCSSGEQTYIFMHSLNSLGKFLTQSQFRWCESNHVTGPMGRCVVLYWKMQSLLDFPLLT